MSRILVVDDDTDICSLMVFKLQAVGHEVLVEHDGEAGLATARTELPDLIVVDWMMPKLTGIEVCAAVRADPALSGTPLILLTAKSEEGDVDRGISAGADAFLVKPFSPRDLARRVEQLLDPSIPV